MNTQLHACVFWIGNLLRVKGEIKLNRNKLRVKSLSDWIYGFSRSGNIVKAKSSEGSGFPNDAKLGLRNKQLKAVYIGGSCVPVP